MKMSEMDLRPELRLHVDAVRTAADRATEALLDLGYQLITLRATCRGGEWVAALAASGVHEGTAGRIMRGAREY